MPTREPTIREMPPPPHIVGLQHFTTYAEIDEILRSRGFRQGSHQESQPFFGRSLLTIDGDEHFERRRLEAPLFAKAALEYYEHTELIPLIGKTLEECRDNRDDDGVVRADLCVLLRTMLARIAAATTGIDGVDTPERTTAFREYVEQLGTGERSNGTTCPSISSPCSICTGTTTGTRGCPSGRPACSWWRPPRPPPTRFPT